MATLSLAQSFLVRITTIVCLFYPALAHAETFICPPRDVGCIIASVAKSNANGPAHDYLYISGTNILTRVDNESPEGPNGLPVITGALTIVGAGQGVTLLARHPDAPLFRLFEVAPTGGLTVAYTTLSNGEVSILFFGRGGCVSNRGSFMLYHSTVRECVASIAGGIDGRGQQTIDHGTIIENYADLFCGGLAAEGRTVIKHSWIGNNVADEWAGLCAIGTPSAPITISRSVIDGNIASRFDGGGAGVVDVEITSRLVSENVSGLRGGGIDLIDGALTIDNSTLWGNVAEIEGGGLWVSAGMADLHGVAVLYNQAGLPGVVDGVGGGISTTQQGAVQIDRVWLLGNEAGRNAQCSGNVTATGWTVVADAGRFHTGPPCE